VVGFVQVTTILACLIQLAPRIPSRRVRGSAIATLVVFGMAAVSIADNVFLGGLLSGMLLVNVVLMLALLAFPLMIGAVLALAGSEIDRLLSTRTSHEATDSVA
jgi:hypothetical protein